MIKVNINIIQNKEFGGHKTYLGGGSASSTTSGMEVMKFCRGSESIEGSGWAFTEGAERTGKPSSLVASLSTRTH